MKERLIVAGVLVGLLYVYRSIFPDPPWEGELVVLYAAVSLEAEWESKKTRDALEADQKKLRERIEELEEQWRIHQ